jgi:peptidoglycan/xylan/chitin deacetylase (PgdA/CDA1 family)
MMGNLNVFRLFEILLDSFLVTVLCVAGIFFVAIGAHAAPSISDTEHCPAGTLYLTIDTGSMTAAEQIADVLHHEKIPATFFVANEETAYGDRVLDVRWVPFWKRLVEEGHAFGNHTWSHATAREDLPDGRLRTSRPDRSTFIMDQDQFCQEMKQVDTRFAEITGQHLSPIWRAPGGKTSARSLEWAKQCGFPKHVGWSDAGFLGDELSSQTYPNRVLLERALKRLRAGDVLMMHLGIRARQDPFVHVFEPLIQGLKAKGFCFAKIASSP